MNRKLAFSLFLAASAPAHAQRPAPFTVAGEGFDTLQAAVNAIGGGEGTIRIAPGRYGDCAVQETGRIAFVAAERGAAMFDGGICEDKATLVLRGRSARIDGLVFTRSRVADGNGAGIRLESGNLTVVYTLFADAQCGILSANDPSSSILIDHSTFRGLGNYGADDGVHALYIGRYGALRVTNSRFERGTSGHYVKSRAARIEVLDSSFDDSRGSNTNYMIDLSNGASGRIAGNVFVNGARKDNYSTMIAVAAEGASNPSAGLVIENNDASLAPGARYATTFVGDWSGEPVAVRGNRLAPRILSFGRR